MIYIICNEPEVALNKCSVIESQKSLEEMLNICSSIQWLYEELQNDYCSLTSDILTNILVEYFGAIDYSASEELQDCFSYKLASEEVFQKIILRNGSARFSYAYLVNMVEARMYCLDENPNETLRQYLSEKKLEELKEMIAPGHKRKGFTVVK